jgi:hypothetical protein
MEPEDSWFVLKGEPIPEETPDSEEQDDCEEQTGEGEGPGAAG